MNTAEQLRNDLTIWYEDGRNNPIVLAIGKESVQVIYVDEASDDDTIILRTLPSTYDWDTLGHPDDEMFEDIPVGSDDAGVMQFVNWLHSKVNCEDATC